MRYRRNSDEPMTVAQATVELSPWGGYSKLLHTAALALPPHLRDMKIIAACEVLAKTGKAVVLPHYVYTVTYASRLPSIASDGLLPSAPQAIGRGGYRGHSTGRIFFTDADGLAFWHSRAEEHAEHSENEDIREDGLVPVVLRIESESITDPKIDEPGVSSATHEAWFSKSPVAPEEIEIWTGVSWSPIDDFGIDPDDALDVEADPDDPELSLASFKRSSPFFPPDEALNESGASENSKKKHRRRHIRTRPASPDTVGRQCISDAVADVRATLASSPDFNDLAKFKVDIVKAKGRWAVKYVSRKEDKLKKGTVAINESMTAKSHDEEEGDARLVLTYEILKAVGELLWSLLEEESRKMWIKKYAASYLGSAKSFANDFVSAIENAPHRMMDEVLFKRITTPE